jgi:hypothetical protein
MDDPDTIPFHILVDLATDSYVGTDRNALAHHLTACPRCRALLAELAHLIELMRTDTSVDPPSTVIQQVLQLFLHHRIGRVPNSASEVPQTSNLHSAMNT